MLAHCALHMTPRYLGASSNILSTRCVAERFTRETTAVVQELAKDFSFKPLGIHGGFGNKHALVRTEKATSTWEKISHSKCWTHMGYTNKRVAPLKRPESTVASLTQMQA